MAGRRPAAVIIGAGLMGRWHAFSLRRLRRPMRAVVDSDRHRAERLARRFGIPEVHESVADLPGEPAAWHVCTPTPTHTKLIESALTAGAHALVEKPMCPTATETERLLDAASAAGLQLCPVHQFLWQRGTLKVLRFIEALGQLRHFRMDVFTAGAAGQDAAGMDAVVADVLPHSLSLLVRVAGPGAEVELLGMRPGPGELFVAGKADGMAIDIRLSAHGRPTRCEAELVGARSTAHLNLFHGYGLFDGGAVSRTRKVVQPFTQTLHTQSVAVGNLVRRALTREPAYPGLRELIRRFYRAAEGRGALPVPPAEALRVSELRDAVLAQTRDA